MAQIKQLLKILNSCKKDMQNKDDHKFISIVKILLLLSLPSINGKSHNHSPSFWKPKRYRKDKLLNTHKSPPKRNFFHIN